MWKQISKSIFKTSSLWARDNVNVKWDHDCYHKLITEIVRKKQKQKSIEKVVQYYLLQLSTNKALLLNLLQIWTKAEKNSRLYDVNLILTTREINEFDAQHIWTIVILIISIFLIDFKVFLNFNTKRNYITQNLRI